MYSTGSAHGIPAPVSTGVSRNPWTSFTCFEAWLETRLGRGLARAERDLVLEYGLFDWFDADLMDEARRVRDSAERIASARALTSLLQTIASSEGRMRLHPLIKGYCAERRAREDPDRARTIHRGAGRHPH